MTQAARSTGEALVQAQEGNRAARSLLFELIYDALSVHARRLMARERAGHTLQPTALVHEVYLRLLAKDVDTKGKTLFFAAALQEMRRLMIELARAHKAIKHGGGWHRVTIDSGILSDRDIQLDFCDLDQALRKLEARGKLGARQASVFLLHHIAKLTYDEIAEHLEAIGSHPRANRHTIKADAEFARAFLQRELRAYGRGLESP